MGPYTFSALPFLTSNSAISGKMEVVSPVSNGPYTFISFHTKLGTACTNLMDTKLAGVDNGTVGFGSAAIILGGAGSVFSDGLMGMETEVISEEGEVFSGPTKSSPASSKAGVLSNLINGLGAVLGNFP